MTALTLAAGALAIGIVVLLCAPLLRPKRFGEKRPDFALAVHRDQLRELERDRERGLLSDDQAEHAKAEI